MEGFYLGVDLGTSSIKVSVSNYNGEIVCAKSHSYPLLTPKKTGQNKILMIGIMHLLKF